MQVKIVAVEVREEPHPMAVATTTVEPGDELLYDYNDRKSRLPFLKQCPVCGENAEPTFSTTSRKRDAPETQSDNDLHDVERDDPPCQQESSSSPKKTKRRKQTTRHTQLEQLAKQTDLSKDNRAKLYSAVKAHFDDSSTVLTRSMLQAWLPSISDDNISRILLKRNMEAANAMVTKIAGQPATWNE